MIPRIESIEELPGTELCRLDRGYLAETGQPVLLKRPRDEASRAGALEALRRESEILAHLAIVSAPKTIGTGLRGDALLIKDPGGSPLTSFTATSASDLAFSLSIGIQVATILEEIHGRGMIHNGVRADAILCDVAGAHAWLSDFSAVSGGATDLVPCAAPSLSVARLVYMSPEQTGRMHRASDHRSDLYALGVVLYELLTGTPPFRSDDTLELIHWHIARTPVAPAEADPRLPRQVSDIVMKLLAKAAEDRYRSARGLRKDLERCAREWAMRGGISRFVLGNDDVGDQFIVSQKLYGREAEVTALLDAFERIAKGGTERPSLMLVAGYSGIGKTSLIQELYKPIVRRKGYFISGKFDQVVRNIPFGALIQAFRALVSLLLTESEARLAQWRSALIGALGANSGVLAEVIPEIELIIGKQPPSVVLGPTEALNRFQMVLQHFLAALARPDHPLVVFLDDLQWADAATLRLLEPLLTRGEIPALFLIGAYRDNEVDATHPLVRTLGALEAAGADVQRVALGPLRLPDLSRLVHDTLQGEMTDAEQLARLVLEKTAGNPFFVTQFLKALKDDGYLQFDYARGVWSYRIEAIAAAPLTDNVIDLMAHKIQRLVPKSKRALMLAACIGNPFDQQTLAVVSEQSPEAVADDLKEAIHEGLIQPVRDNYDSTALRGGEVRGPTYAFLHDRVQQSAYALIPEERKQNVHLAAGQLLRSRAAADEVEERIFDIVHHMNLGRSLIDDEVQQLDLARLDLSAGRKAKASTAYEAALGYLRAGLGLVARKHWESDYELTFALHFEAAESEYLCGHFDTADRLFAVLLQDAASSLDLAKVYRLRSLQYENMARYADALASARRGLALFGVLFPDSSGGKEAALEREIAAIHSVLGSRSIASLIELPVMTDPEVRMVMSIMTDMWASVYLVGDPLLARLISATMVRQSLEFGNAEESAYGYVTHAITVGPVRGEYESAYEFGKLALKVNESFHDSRRRAKICQQFHAHVNFWRQPWHTCIPYAREACRAGLENGDFLYAAYGAGTEAWAAILATQDLAQFIHEYAPSVALLTKLQNAGFADSMKIILNWARALQGNTAGPLSLSDATIDENEYLSTYRGNAFFTTFHAVARLHLCYVFGEHEEALRAMGLAREVVYQLAGTVWPPVFEFWNGLTLAANYAAATEERKKAYVEELEGARRSFAILAENCPENFLCQSFLLSAEIERICERPSAALEFYERAIGYAEQTGMVQHLALANELYGRFRLARGQGRLAALFLSEARVCYARWGAAAKVRELERRYPDLLDAGTSPLSRLPAAACAEGVPASSHGDAGMLDLMSVMKAAHAIASEIEWERLLARLLGIAIENAGAERGSLLLEHAGELLVDAEGTVGMDSVTVHAGIPFAEAQGLPASIVNYVRRTWESIVLADAQSDDRFSGDPYVVHHRPRSVMCLPVLTQGRLVGILYLENHMLRGAFTPDRARIVQLLSAEAAISLENAKLFGGLKAEIRERTEAQEKLRAALTQVERLKNELEAENRYLRRDLIANVSHDLRTPLTSLRGYLETLLIREDGLSTAERRGFLETAVRQSQQLAALVEQLFELVKLDFRGVQLSFEPLQLSEFAGDVVQKFRLEAEQKRVTLNFEPLRDMPPVEADLGLLERVFDNLIGNALRHTPAGGEVKVSVALDGERALVRIADTGGGIPETEIPFIFERFYRVDRSRSGATGGAGLGLAITKRILELHDGSIAVESARLSGTCFSFSLPLRGTVARFVA